MDIQVLRNFLVVASEENVTRAAEILHIAQPTLSRQIQNLEEELGCTLFERKNKRVRLTNQGLILQQRATEMIELYYTTRSELDPVPGVYRGDINVAFSEVSSVNNVLRTIKQFQEMNPEVLFHVFSGGSMYVMDMISSGTADLGLLMGYLDDTKYEGIQISSQERLGILVKPDHPLSDRKTVTVKDIAEEPLILSRYSATRVPSVFDISPDHVDIRATYTMLSSAALMVKAGIGIALIPCSMTEFWSSSLVTVPFEEPVSVPTHIFWRKNTPLPEQTMAFLDALRKSIGT